MRRILLAFDGGPAAWGALDRAATIALGLDAEVGVVHVLPARRSDLGEVSDSVPLQQADEALRTRGIEPALHIARGDPVEQIAALALDLDYDTVVVGSRRSGLFGHLLEARVSTALAGHASVPVIVVPTDPT